MKHCLVTGGAGFIGSHLTESLLADGHRVLVVDDESTGSVDNLIDAWDHPNFGYVKGSAADVDLVRELVEEVDEVYHLAAVVGVNLVLESPLQAVEGNIHPTEVVLRETNRQHQRGRPVKLFLASTSEVYGKNPKKLLSEDDDLVLGATVRSRWCYGASKAIDEFLALAYWQEHRLPIVICRLFNCVGPRQSASYGMVLPRFVEAALANRKLTVYGDGQQVRCFAHVADVVHAVRGLMQTPSAVGRVLNVGSDRPVTIQELAEHVIEAVAPGLEMEFLSYSEAYSSGFEDCRHRVPDLSQLRRVFDFRTTYDLDDIIQSFVTWKLEHTERVDNTLPVSTGAMIAPEEGAA